MIVLSDCAYHLQSTKDLLRLSTRGYAVSILCRCYAFKEVPYSKRGNTKILSGADRSLYRV
jgi:hypothetical protein